MNTQTILKAFGLQTDNCEIKPLGDGLINTTWLVREISTARDFVFQQINTNVFKRPDHITFNIRLISDFLEVNHPDYLFTSPVKALDGTDMVKSDEGGYFRLFGYIHGSVTHNELKKPLQAFEAARQFGQFTNLLSGIDISLLKTTIPDFHNLTLRYEQFVESLKNATPERLENAREAIDFLIANKSIADAFLDITQSQDFKLRVTHHDTKISNVLFDSQDNGLCVIDLDTVMPGYFISDVGDMMRTYLSPVSEEEKDFSKIEVRPDFFLSIVKGYLSEMKDQLTAHEKKSIYYAGKFMIYMQAIRFIADYLNNDIYYGSRYEGQNLVRGKNQVTLLQRYMDQELSFSKIIDMESKG